MMPATASAAAKPYVFGCQPGPLPGTWVATLRCPHGVSRCYLAARRLQLPDEGVVVLELLVARHRVEHPRCRCLGQATL